MKTTRYFDSRHKSLVEEAIAFLPDVVFNHYVLCPKFILGEYDQEWLPFTVEYENPEFEIDQIETALYESIEMAYCFIQGYLIGKGVPKNEA
jgi:hypothetical protein